MEICICLWQPVSTVICMYFLLRTILATNSPENKKTKKTPVLLHQNRLNYTSLVRMLESFGISISVSTSSRPERLG